MLECDTMVIKRENCQEKTSIFEYRYPQQSPGDISTYQYKLE